MNKLPDLSTPWQKAIAAGLLLLGGFIVVKLFTFIIAGIFILIGIVFHRQIWDAVRQFSEFSTRWMIKNNTVYYLRKYYDHLLKEYQDFAQATKDVGAEILTSEKRVNDLIQKRKKAIELHARTQDPNLEGQYETEAYSLKEQIDFLMPVLDGSKAQYSIMKQIEEMRAQDLKKFEIRMNNNIEKFEILKGLNNASNKARKFLGTNSAQEKQYKEAARQLEKSVSSYIINIEDTNRKMLPELQKLQVENTYNQEKGREIIEAYKKSRLEIPQS